MSADTILPQLLELICDLYDDSQDFPDRTDDAQLWYNRGYANGVIHALHHLGYARHVAAALEADAQDRARARRPCPGVRPTVTAGKWGGKRPLSSWQGVRAC